MYYVINIANIDNEEAYDDEYAYSTKDEAERERQREILDACREDVLCGRYSKRAEAEYWRTLVVVER